MKTVWNRKLGTLKGVSGGALKGLSIGTAVGILNGTLREQYVYCVFVKGIFRAEIFEVSQ